MKTKFSFLFTLLFTFYAQAGEIWDSTSHKVHSTIVSSPQNTAFIKLEQMSVNPCGEGSPDFYALPFTNDAAKELYATLLGAAHAKSSVQLAFDDTNCSGSRPIITRVRIYY